MAPNSLRGGRLTLAVLAIVALAALAWPRLRTGLTFSLSASSSALHVQNAQYRYLPLDSVSRVELRGATVEVSGDRLGWLDFDGRRSTSTTVSQQLNALSAEGEDVTSEWSFLSATRIKHGPSDTTVDVQSMGWRAPVVFAVRRQTAQSHLIVFADGDWKAGPSAYLATVLVEGAPLVQSALP